MTAFLYTRTENGVDKMIQTFKIIIESKDSGNLYYPKMISCSVSKTYPFICSTASLTVQTYFDSKSYISPYLVDDIIRVQVSQKIDESEDNLFIDIFEGRITGISNTLGAFISLECRGHEEEYTDKYITSDYTGDGKGSGVIFEELTALYLTRITDNGLCDDGTTITSFNTAAWTKTISDVIHELERIELYDYIASVDVNYDSNNNLSSVYMDWQQLSTTPINTLKLIEGTDRIISASFKSTKKHILNYIKVFGSDPGTQYTDFAEDTTSQTSYGKRTTVITDLGLDSNALCGNLADGVLARWKDIVIIGSVDIIGSEYVKPGDLVTCKFPSVDVCQSSIDDDYRVKRVSHIIDSNGFFTKLDLGEVEPSLNDVLNNFYNKNKLNNANSIS